MVASSAFTQLIFVRIAMCVCFPSAENKKGINYFNENDELFLINNVSD
ncbi:hypothetical protein CSB69_1208 [Morganella morganii]|nr:hypothetical protein CSB69_1208 [Morganella morganii]